MSRTIPSPKVRELAQRLVTYEATADNPSEPNMPAVFHVTEKLRRPLTTLAGIAGFRSLLARSLTLAKAQVPGLSAVRIEPDGALEGFSGLGDYEQSGAAGVTLIAQLLGLLVTFVGEALMLSLVLGAWPELPVFEDATLEKSEHDLTK